MTARALLVTLLAALAPAPAGATPIVHHPADGALVTGDGRLHVVAEPGPDGASLALEAQVNGTPVAVIERRGAAGGRMLHAAATLTPGVNHVTLIFVGPTAGRGYRLERRVFFASPLHPDAGPPAGFVRAPFHAGDTRACSGCHETVARPDDAQPASPEASTCFSCHAENVRRPHVHGPAAQWACTRCHDPTSAPARYATPEPVMPLCFSCHEEQKTRFYGEAYQHGPTATGHCVICHSPHGSANPFFLKKATWDLCTTCHAEKGSGRHVISWGPSGQTHPTRGRVDPNRRDQELSCASCHNPHAAPAPKLWNFKATLWLDLCKNCHRAIIGGGS